MGGDAVPLLSIIVPIYNVELYLQQCVDSILRQTFEDFELILVNDGSTDNSPNICDEYAARDARIIVVHKENGGLVSARKAGLSIAKGKYIGYVDSDDWIEADMYQALCDAAQAFNVDIVICDIIENYLDYEVRSTQIVKPGLYRKDRMIKEVYPMMLYAGRYYQFGLFPSVSNKIFKKSLLEKFQFRVDDQIRMGEDVACTYPSLLNAKSIYLLDKQYLYHYRKNPSSMTASYDQKFFEKILVLYKHLRGLSPAPYFANQLQYYLTYLVIAGVHNEFHRENKKSLREKRVFLKKMLKHRDINEVLQAICPNTLPFKVKIITVLLKRQSIFLLYVLARMKQKTNFRKAIKGAK
ncbi:putative glycosyltransferase EpsJ [Lysinibacillus sphaericus]|uniref:Putative glycosyltransferase EpsJ n=1 Tax=Lysinibacillus sphaericus TaxID=1421 RepID=A0A2S5D3D5_LYSSH|nr:putative glycosyltransferase EpsJ [Lysinibacillus sphaericus]